MTKIIFNKFDKTRIPSLPVAQFEGRIVVVLNEAEAEKAVDYLLTQPILGFDTETRPSFSRGHQHRVALLQVATKDVCFLFRLNYTGLNAHLVRLLQDTTVTKVALSWNDDINSLHRIGQFNVGHFIEIQDIVKDLGIEDMSLQKIYANLFGMKISKRQQLSNWEANILNDKQKMYAATDAWACINIYNEIVSLKKEGNYNLVVKEDNDEKDIS